MSIPLLPEVPPELVVHDRPSRCPYLEGRTARLPLRLPVRRLSRNELDDRLALGDGRQGLLLYRASCPSCVACEPIRIDVPAFRFTRSQRRVLARGDRELRLEIGRPRVDAARVALYNAHKLGRGLTDGQPPIDEDGYRDFLVESCCDSLEFVYWLGEHLAAVAIADRGAEGLSAVYCHFDPELSALCIGTYAILKQVELCRRWGLRWLYLGLYIEECDRMLYKARFHPHERLLNGRWERFDADAAAAAMPPATR